MKPSLAEVIERAARSDGPVLTSVEGMPRLGGVDPLGLRQINFDLMNEVLPGLNNAGQRIRPFVVVAWAARQAKRLGDGSVTSELVIRDFIDRIEVLYAWSQFLRDTSAQLPGRQVLGPLVAANSYEFGGEAWEGLKDSRKQSTAFTAAITYGPSIKALCWAGPVPGAPQAWASSGLFEEALDAFEATFAHELSHSAFSKLGAVRVSRADVQRWASLWNMDEVTEEEQAAFSSVLCGNLADESRRNTLSLLQSVCEAEPELEYDEIRAAMAEVPGDENPARAAWRRLQVRQAFRYALESWFHWCLLQLGPGPKTSAQLVEAFCSRTEGWARLGEPGSWLTPPAEDCPIAFISEIRQALTAGGALPEAVCRTLAFCFHEALAEERPRGRADRLPLWRARAEADAWKASSSAAFITHMMETWLFAQHAYWSSSRSLADARAHGKVILRLRVTLDEGGWRLSRRGAFGSVPYPTPDRLETAWTLADEAGVL